MTLNINTTTLPLSSNVNIGTKVVSGLPAPKDGFMQLPTYFTSKSSSSYPMITGSVTSVKSDGLYLINNNDQYVNNWGILISGTYLMA